MNFIFFLQQTTGQLKCRKEGMKFIEKLSLLERRGLFSARQGEILRQFYQSYLHAHQVQGKALSEEIPLQFLDLIVEQIRAPYPFQPFHTKITHPINYAKFGLDMIRPLIDFKRSALLGEENIERIERQLEKGDNCILYANHQTEADPQAIHLLLEKKFPKLGEKLVMVAGDRVISDPLAVPFSKGCTMLCIFSRKHIDHPPEKKLGKLHHNRRALRDLVERLSKGGICIYIAPSGGRDRLDREKGVTVAPFDCSAIDLFYLLAQQSKTTAHFYPLSLATYHLLPPPNRVEEEIGEDREFHFTAIGAAFGEEFYEKEGVVSKKERRQQRCDSLYEKVCTGYRKLQALLPKG